MKQIDIFNKDFSDSITIRQEILNSKIYKDKIIRISNLIRNAFANGNKLIVAGNGGSASDAMHIVAELVGRFIKERLPYEAICLNTNVSSITAIANDYSYDCIFERQIEACGKKNDIYIGISTSGNSKNILKSFIKSKELGCINILFTGDKDGDCGKYADLILNVPSNITARIQEVHITYGHIICELIENE